MNYRPLLGGSQGPKGPSGDPPGRGVSWVRNAALVMVSGAIGWAGHAWWTGSPLVAPGMASAPGVPPAAGDSGGASAPMWPAPFQSAVTLLEDGRVTVHADRVPPAWLVDEIARATGQPLAAAAQPAPGTAVNPGSPTAAIDSNGDDLLRNLRQGSAEQRLAALSRAEDEGIALPLEELQRLAETDPSEQVRIAAFMAYTDELSNRDSPMLRAALQSALRTGSVAIQVEARRRIEELEEYERANPPARPQGR